MTSSEMYRLKRTLITNKSEGKFMQTYAAVWVSSPSDLTSGKLEIVLFFCCEFKEDALAVFWKSYSKLSS